MKKYFGAVRILLICAAITVFLSDYGKVLATETIQDSIRQKQDAINQAKEDRKKLESGLSDIRQMVEELNEAKDSLESYIVQLDAQLSDVSDKITELSNLIVEKEAEIVQAKAELEEAELTVQEQYETMKSRIKFMYEQGNRFYLELMLGAESFGDMLNKAEYVTALSAYENEVLETYKLNREYLAACKEELEAEEAVLQEAKLAVEEEQRNLEVLISSKEQQIVAYSSDINTKEQAIAEYEAEIEAQNKLIRELEAALAAENNKLKYDGGMFAWPCPSYKRISDDYGWRIHPTLGVEQFHNGIDLAAPGGSPILAAYDGQVMAASYEATMGNYVMIDHGDGLITIYMHASALYVSKGAMVSKGDTIAAVGTTGRSTGNHLHFGVRLSGQYVSPWNYISN